MTQTKPYIDELPVASIRPNPDNPRRNLGDLAELAASIREQGIIEPLVVEPDTDPRNEGGWLLVAGHRRLAAAKRADLTVVPALVHPETTTRTQRLELMLVENLQREDLTDVEEGDTYQLLLDMPDAKYSVATLAERIGRPKKYVKERVRAAGLPESARERILRGQITLEQSSQIAPFVKDTAEMERINRAAESGPIALATALEEARRRRERRQEYQRALRAARAEGLTVYGYAALPDEFAELTEIEARVTPEEHQGLECHAVYITESAETIAICTNPDSHEPAYHRPAASTSASPAAETPADDVEADAERAEEEARQVEKKRREREEREAEAKRRADLQLRLEARQVVRTQFLHDVMFDEEAATKVAAEEMRRRMTVFLSGFRVEERTWMGQLLFPSMDRASLADSKTLKKRIERRIEDMPAPALVVLEMVLRQTADDQVLTIPVAANATQLIWAEKWLRTLQETFDYEPGDAETEFIETEKKRFEA